MPEPVFKNGGVRVSFEFCPNAAARLRRCLGVLAILIALVLPGILHPQSSLPIYLDPQQPIELRVNDLMSRMTLKEKVGQLNLPCVYVDNLGKTIPEKLEACRRFATGTQTS